MNSEQYAADYTAEEQQAVNWQSAPPVLHVDRLWVGDTRVRHNGRGGRAWLTKGDGWDAPETVRYVRSDLYDAQAARVVELEQQLSNCTVDLAKLDECRGQPNEVYLIVQATQFGGVPVAYARDEATAQKWVEGFAEQAHGLATYRYHKIGGVA